jgi:hypothetical protein
MTTDLFPGERQQREQFLQSLLRDHPFLIREYPWFCCRTQHRSHASMRNISHLSTMTSSAARAILFAACLVPAMARAQAARGAAGSAGEREVRGTISHVTHKGARPLSGAWVTLHRVGTDHAGPVDSARTGESGRYDFRYHATGDTNALYFVSSRFAGIAYFTPPLKERVVTGTAADLIVYDTTSAPVTIHVRGRHVVVMAPDSGRSRRVVEVFELSNDTSVTRVAGARERPTFETVLPDGASDFRAGDGEVTGDALAFAAGRARVLAPIPPGIKQFSFNYRLAATREAIAVPSVTPVTVLEVLVEDVKGTVSGAGLRETEGTTVNGRRFRRFLAQDASTGVISVTAPTISTASSLNTRIALIVTAVGATLLLGLATGQLRRRPAIARARRATSDAPEALEREIAALETAFAELESPGPDERADHYEARARLKARLTAALARRDGLI